MAISIEGIRRKIHVSIKGRRIGLTPRNGYLAGPPDILRPVSNATSATTATALAPYGFHTLSTTTNSGWVLTDPSEAGLRVSLATVTTSTGNHAVTPAAATIISTNGVAGSSMTLQGIGASIELLSISTAQWIVTSRYGTTSGLLASATVSS